MKFGYSQKIFICGLILLVQFVCFAQSEAEKGTALYEQGLSYEKQGKTKEAIKSYERIVNDTISTMESSLEKEFAGKRVTSGQESWKDFIQRKMGENVSIAIRSIERLKEINPQKASSPEWETKSLILETFAKKDEETPDADKPSTSRPIKIINKPIPEYTAKARSERTSGVIRLRAMFLSNGRIGLVVPFNRLPEGLTESAIEAARKITFEPWVKDEKPATVFKMVEFSFHSLN